MTVSDSTATPISNTWNDEDKRWTVRKWRATHQPILGFDYILQNVTRWREIHLPCRSVDTWPSWACGAIWLFWLLDLSAKHPPLRWCTVRCLSTSQRVHRPRLPRRIAPDSGSPISAKEEAWRKGSAKDQVKLVKLIKILIHNSSELQPWNLEAKIPVL